MPYICQVKGRELTLAVLTTVVSLLFFCQPSYSNVLGSEPQKRPRRQTRGRASNPKPADRSSKYSKFTHKSHGKDSKDARARNLKCANCHIIPSAGEPDRIAASTKPGAVVGYPYHDSCFQCHRPQVYQGDRPAFCTVCHTRVSPRLTSRDVYSKFPNPKNGNIIEREFPGFFPHGLHQSLMAMKGSRRSHDIQRPGFLRTSFNPEDRDNAPPKALDVCATCHFTDKRAPLELPLKGIPGDESFKTVDADTFKTTPGDVKADGHASCFNCHWQGQKPFKDDCNGCHLSRSDYAARKLEIVEPPALSPNAMRWFENWPLGLPKRLSLKFRHDTHTLSSDQKTETNNHDVGCTACHINITEMTTLNIPKADVQIISCAPCHTKTASIPVGLGVKVTIFDEMELKGDTDKKYKCVACHTSVIGREQPPCSHYSVIGEQCPKASKAEGE